MDIQKEIKQTLKVMGKGKAEISPSVYDIAWIARLNEEGIPMGTRALEWLRDNQLEDGSWGEAHIPYNHERLVNTLAASVSIARQKDQKDKQRLGKAKTAIAKYSKGVAEETIGETIGFEMIVPTLLKDAKELNLIQGSSPYLDKLTKKRNAKIAALPNGFVNRNSTVIFSAEMIQESENSLLDVDNMIEANGSIGCSPAATVWFFKHAQNSSQDLTLNFLKKVVEDNEMAPYIVPIDVFETAWSLWNIALIDGLSEDILAQCRPLLDFLESQWSLQGLSAVSEFPVPDGDTTAMVHEVMTKFGRPIDLAGLLSFRAQSHFYCYRIESDPSISTNVHVLSALYQAGLPKTDPSVEIVREFLRKSRTSNSHWNDKWHISPYYTTSHGIIASLGYDPDMAQVAVEWLINTQAKSGGWGKYLPTAEETAYAIQALVIWKRYGGHVPNEVLIRGKAWLEEHAEDSQPFLWIGKSLYKPNLVIRTAILSALALADQEV